MTVIEFQNVKKSYKSHNVLNEISFKIEPNTLTGIIGRNGVGKTTLMKMIAGFIEENAGRVEVFSERPFNSLKVSSNTIFIDDQMPFPPAMTIEDILNECKRFFHNWDHALAFRLLDYFQLLPQMHPNTLSKGKKSTLNAIIGLSSRSLLTIFDEPTTGMDAAVRKDFYRALLKDYIDHPRTILLSSHHIEEIENLLENALLIHQGNALFHGSITDLQEMFVSVIGKEKQLALYVDSKNMVTTQDTGPYTIWTVKNQFTNDELVAMEKADIRISPVSANEAYIALTQQTTGGIDDVFK